MYFPIHLDIAGKLCVVVGGGPIAERKIRGLLGAGARVRVVALEVTASLQEIHAATSIELILAPYERAHLAGARLVFAATNRQDINSQVAADARADNVWVNRADVFEEGDFIVPAVVRNGELCLSVSTGGNQPLLTARIAQELQDRFGPGYGAYVELLGRMRHEIKADCSSAAARRAAMEALLEAEAQLRKLLQAGEGAPAMELARQLITDRAARDGDSAQTTVTHEEIPASVDTGG